jgi:DNA-nicking Smr family endonuclease
LAKPRSKSNDPQGDDSAVSDEALLFRAAVRDVKPLERTAPVATTATTAAATTAAASATRSSKPRQGRRAAASAAAAFEEPAHDMPLLADSVPAEDSVTGADVLSFRRPGVRTQTLRHLRRGLFPVEDQLDLHGLNQSAARDSLAEFIEQSRGAGYRCVRIVHGKGYRSGARGPILKIAVNSWLKRHGNVMAFTSARTIDGGTGAVYVLLRA